MGKRNLIHFDIGETAHCHQSVGLRSRWKARKPVVATSEILGEKICYGRLLGAEVSHYRRLTIAGNRLCSFGRGIVGDETIHRKYAADRSSHLNRDRVA